MPELTGLAVAKKTPKKLPAESPPPDTSNRKPMVVQMRGSEEWKAWIERLAEHENDTVSKLLERLAARHAKSIGFEPMPKR